MSKKLLGILLSLTLVAAMCCTAVVSASADSAIAKTDTTVDDSGKGLHAGDQVEYTANLTYGNDADEDFVQAFDASVYYDTAVLSIAKKNNKPMASFAKFVSATANYELDGEIKFNAADGANGLRAYDDEAFVVTDSFANGNKIIKVTFDVVADADSTAIGFEARELFNMAGETITDGVSFDVNVICNKQEETSDVDSDDSDVPPVDSDDSDVPPVDSDDSDVPPVDSDDSDEPVVDSDEPVVDSDEPVVDSDEPVVDSDEPVVDSDEPVVDSEDPTPVDPSDTDVTTDTSSDSGKTTPVSPVTGDATATVAIVLVLAAAAVVAVVARKRFA